MVDNRLDFLDQASFLRLRASGVESVNQVTWYYNRPVDLDGVGKINEALTHSLVGRRIERSPLPFGRPRWVDCPDAPPINVAPTPLSRDDVSRWLDECSQIPVDPEYGPCWHFNVVPFDDGGSAVTLVASHTVTDAAGLALALFEAIYGVTRDLDYPPPGSRTLFDAVRADLWDAIRGLPAVFAAILAMILLLVRRDNNTAASGQPANHRPLRAPIEQAANYLPPSITAYVDLSTWDAHAADLGVSSNVLFMALSTKLAQLVGRVSAIDGSVLITMPISQRTPEDTTGNMLTAATFSVDPDQAIADPGIVRDAMKRALAELETSPNELLKPLPLVPYTPKWLARRLQDMAMSTDELPVCCSNLRDAGQALVFLDGVSNADYADARMANRGVTRSALERQHGELYLFSGRAAGQIFFSVSAYTPGTENTKESLRAVLDQAITDYGLVAQRFE